MIKSAFENVHNNRFNCSLCIKKNKEDFREKVLGCTGKLPINKDEGNFFYNRCGGNFINPGYIKLFEVFKLYKQGILFCSGGLSDQPAKYLSLMTHIEFLFLQRDAEKLNLIQQQRTKKEEKNGRK